MDRAKSIRQLQRIDAFLGRTTQWNWDEMTDAQIEAWLKAAQNTKREVVARMRSKVQRVKDTYPGC